MVRTLDEGDAVDPWRRRERRSRRQMPLWQELPLLLVVAFCLAVLIRTFLLQAFFIPSGSMEDTLLVNDRVLVNKVVYDVRDPQRGEVVVFRGTDKWVAQEVQEPEPGIVGKFGRTVGDLVGVSRPGEKDFIKRVIGVPGDRVRCCDAQGRVTVNDIPLDEPYVIRDSPLDLPPNPAECRSRRFDEVVVPPGQIFVMGDHRLVSQDARCQGPVPIENVVGRAFAVVWPSSRWASLPVPETFATVTGPTPAAGQPLAPVRPSGTGGVLLLLPVSAALSVLARSGRPVRLRRRRLHP
ncbi:MULTISPECIES: signal peptidase I [Micromonospora]|uniref:Signal peptidase I n=1 Tax=Micromonospora carbonacea TaxID=47853 RepID=A0A7H8XHP5_9ACTN|nr:MULTISPECIES: signal peptidase I [Micromonospora]MBB5828168.1 signal peptidase I [Micromonospora carbonacea]QLD24190.1 signal peptidase I [Micromonospora carbonacea]WFE60501.1 signal peptidase I [Micromonospora sp. WMMD712]